MCTFLTSSKNIFSLSVLALIVVTMTFTANQALAKFNHKTYVCSATLQGATNPHYSTDICNYCSDTLTSEMQCVLKVSEMIETCNTSPTQCDSAKKILSGLGAPVASETIAAEPGTGLYAGEPVEPEYTELSPQMMPEAQKPGTVLPETQTGGGASTETEINLNEEFEMMMGDGAIESETDMKAALAKFAGQLQNKNGLESGLSRGLMLAKTLNGSAVNEALSNLSSTSAWNASEVSSGEVLTQANALLANNSGAAANSAMTGGALNTQWCSVDADCNEPGMCCDDNACLPCSTPPQTTPPEQNTPKEQTSWPICDGPTAKKYMSDCDVYEAMSSPYSSWNVLGAKGGIRMPYYNKDGMAVPPERINIVWEGPEAELHFCLCQGGACDNSGCVMPADGSGDPSTECPGNYVEAPKYKCDEPSPQQVADACGITATSGTGWPAIAGTYGKLTSGYCESLYDKCDYGLICPDGGEAHVSTDCTH